MARSITNLLLVLAVVTMTANGAAARQFKKPVFYPTNDNVYGIVSADFNHDGTRDLAFAEFFTGRVGIMLGKGDGTFESPVYFSAPGAIALAADDFNGDHALDLAVVEYGGTGHSALGIFSGDGQGNFKSSATYELGIESASLTVADFNGDGHLDVAVTSALGYGKNEKPGAYLFSSARATERSESRTCTGWEVSHTLLLLATLMGIITPTSR